MKHIPGKPTTHRLTSEDAARLARQDKRKIIVLTIGLVLLIAAFVTSNLTAKRKKSEEHSRLLSGVGGPASVLESEIFVPEFPERAVLDAVQDTDENQQVRLDEAAVLATLKYAQKLTPAQLDQLGLHVATDSDHAALMQAPAAHRLQALTVRGKVKEVRARPGTAETPGTLRGILQTEQGPQYHFVVSDLGMNELPNDVLRLDGLFVQLYKAEIQREWVTAPLLVGRRLLPSYSRLLLNEDLDTPALQSVKDDEMGDVTGIPDEAKWELMAKALQGGDRIDWDSAPEINDEYLGRMIQGDPSLRGQPFRFPIRINADSRTVRANENPLMRETFMEGWLGDYTSKKSNGLVHWVAAIDNPALHDFQGSARFVTARGFFLKSWLYDKADGSTNEVPFFVMESVNVHDPIADKSHTQMLWIMLGLTVVILGLFTWLLSRDKRQTEALQRRLVERRRARSTNQTT